VYPTWFRDGDPILLDVVAGDRHVGLRFNATLPEASSDRAIVRDVSLETAGMGAWYAALIAVAVVAALGLVAAFLFWRRWRKFMRIP